MKNLTRKLASSFLLFGVSIFVFSVDSVNAQRNSTRESKQLKINRLVAKGLKELNAGQHEAAIKTYTECVELRPVLQNANNCYFGRAMSYFLFRDFEKSVPDFTESFKSVNDNQSKYMRGRSYFLLKKYDEAFKDFDYVIKLAKIEDIKEFYPEVYSFRGVVLAGRGEFQKAIADYTRTIDLKPNYTDAYYTRGIAFGALEEFEKAEADLKKTLEINPLLKEEVNEVLRSIEAKKEAKIGATDTNVDSAIGATWFELSAKGDLAKSNKELGKAIGYYTLCLKIENLQADCLNNRMHSYFESSQVDKAFEDLATMIENDIKRAEAYGTRGIIQLSLNKFEPAILDLSKAIELQPAFANHYGLRGVAYIRQGKYDLAISDVAKAFELDPDERIYRKNLIIFNTMAGNYDEALKLSEKFSSEKMLDANYPHLRAGVYLAMKEYKKAIEQYDLALRLNPTRIDSYTERARAFCLSGEIAKAKADEKAVIDFAGKIEKPCQ